MFLVLRDAVFFVFLTCIWVILRKVRNSCPSPKYYIFFLFQISRLWRFVLIKVVDYLTLTTVTGTGVQIFFSKWIVYPPPPTHTHTHTHTHTYLCLSHLEKMKAPLQFDKNRLRNKTKRGVIFGRNLPMTEASNILWFWFEAVSYLFLYVPQFMSSLLPQLHVKIIQSYYPWKLHFAWLLWGTECSFSKNIKLFRKKMIQLTKVSRESDR